jgi:hypothetical protein
VKSTKAAQERQTPRLRVNVKLTGDADPGRSRGLLSQLRGVQSVIQTFPDETDQELKRLFVLEIDASDVESSLKELRRCPEVEYVEKAPLRKLIRQIR